MPMLDVSFVTADPMLADVFSVTRRVESVDTKGRNVPGSETAFLAQAGVVTQEDPAELMRSPDGQIAPRRIFVASRFAFRGATDGFKPDIIRWPVNADGTERADSTDYTVMKTYPYSRYGAGMHECVAESTIAVDVPQ